MTINQQQSLALGRHINIEFYGCSHEILLDKNRLNSILVDAAQKSGATVISSSFHHFTPQGVSGVVIIAESHFTIHTWPEHDYAAVDMFTCGDRIDFNIAIKTVSQDLESKHTQISSDQNRGLISRQTLDINATQDPDQAPAGSQPDSTFVPPTREPVSWEMDFEQARPWGLTASVDIYGCATGIIDTPEKIASFTDRLLDKIGAPPLEPCRVTPQKEDEQSTGFTMTRTAQDALISGHFIPVSGAVYLDLTLRRFYESRETAEFALSVLKGSSYRLQVGYRR